MSRATPISSPGVRPDVPDDELSRLVAFQDRIVGEVAEYLRCLRDEAAPIVAAADDVVLPAWRASLERPWPASSADTLMALLGEIIGERHERRHSPPSG